MSEHRTRLYGKKVTEEEIVREISRLLLGDPERLQDPLSVTDVAKTLGFVRTTVYKYVKIAVEKYKFLEYKDGRICLPDISKQMMKFRRFDKKHNIMLDPLVLDWKQDLLTRKNGEPIVTWKKRILSLESVCNTCRVNPRDLIISQRQTEKILKNYSHLYREGRIDNRISGRKRISDDIKYVIYQRVQAVRDFCGFYNIIWRRGVGGIMSQKIPNHGKYADIRLTDNELEQADRFIKEKWGLDSDVYRWFWIGIESCSRFEGLYSMSLEYTKHIGRNGKTTFIMTAFESKTKHIKNGKWIKYITRSDTQKSIDMLKSRNGTRIHESQLSKYNFTKMIRQALKEVYDHLGKKNYFMNHTSHALRHVGAHYWLAKVSYNYGLVAMIGGWNTIDELKKSYGELPPEKVLEMIDDPQFVQVQVMH